MHIVISDKVIMVRDTEEKESKQGDISEKVIDEGKDKLFQEQNKIK